MSHWFFFRYTRVLCAFLRRIALFWYLGAVLRDFGGAVKEAVVGVRMVIYVGSSAFLMLGD